MHGNVLRLQPSRKLLLQDTSEDLVGACAFHRVYHDSTHAVGNAAESFALLLYDGAGRPHLIGLMLQEQHRRQPPSVLDRPRLEIMEDRLAAERV